MLQIESELKNDNNKFKDLYQFTFNFAKSQNQKSLDLEDAIAYWKMILETRFKNLDTWIQFLQVDYSKLIKEYLILLERLCYSAVIV